MYVCVSAVMHQHKLKRILFAQGAGNTGDSVHVLFFFVGVLQWLYFLVYVCVSVCSVAVVICKASRSEQLLPLGLISC